MKKKLSELNKLKLVPLNPCTLLITNEKFTNHVIDGELQKSDYKN